MQTNAKKRYKLSSGSAAVFVCSGWIWHQFYLPKQTPLWFFNEEPKHHTGSICSIKTCNLICYQITLTPRINCFVLFFKPQETNASSVMTNIFQCLVLHLNSRSCLKKSQQININNMFLLLLLVNNYLAFIWSLEEEKQISFLFTTKHFQVA